MSNTNQFCLAQVHLKKRRAHSIQIVSHSPQSNSQELDFFSSPLELNTVKIQLSTGDKNISQWVDWNTHR